MPTLDGLIGRVRRQLLGHTLMQEVVLELAQSMTETSTSLTVTGSARDLSRGLVEIDDELILVRRTDQATSTATVMGGTAGRGREGTEAAAHSAGSLVTVAPAFPRVHVREAVQDAIRGLYPQLVCFGTTDITVNSVVYEYELPEEAQSVWSVTTELVGPTKMWTPAPNYRFNPDAPPTFASGKSIQLLDAITPGKRARVVYSKRPQVLSDGSDDWSETGYPDSVADLAVWGACARLVPAAEAARLQQTTVEAAHRAEIIQPQTALRTAAYYQALYSERLAEERRRMFAERPQYQTFQG